MVRPDFTLKVSSRPQMLTERTMIESRHARPRVGSHFFWRAAWGALPSNRMGLAPMATVGAAA